MASQIFKMHNVLSKYSYNPQFSSGIKSCSRTLQKAPNSLLLSIRQAAFPGHVAGILQRRSPLYADVLCG